MINVGIGDDHGAGCAIESNGRILYASSEERFSRHKNDAGFPIAALENGLNYLGKGVNDIENIFIATAERTDYLSYEYRRDCLLSINDYQEMMDHYWKPKLEGLSYPKSLPLKLISRHKKFSEKGFYGIPMNNYMQQWSNDDYQKIIKESVSVSIGIDSSKIHFVDHHTCHAAYAIATAESLPKEFAVVTVDSYGDGRNQTVWLGKDNSLINVAESKNCPLARIYRFTTLYLGMRPLEHEYKVMGLSTYANPSYYQNIVERLMELVEFHDLSILQNSKISNLYDAISKIYRGERFDNIAGAVQQFTEVVLKRLFNAIFDQYRVSDFYYSGGVAMNVKANKEILGLGCVDSLIVPGAPDDVSVPIGACLAQYINKQRREFAPVNNMYLGPEISSKSIDKTLSSLGLKGSDFTIQSLDNEIAADLLTQGEVVGRVSGRMEFGARALGNRSILAVPNSWDTVDLINDMIKNRDFWMPFAATVLDIDMDKVIQDNWKKSDPRFMTIAFDTKTEFWPQVKAGTHRKDKTMRVHMLRREDNPNYYDLILAVRERTGIGAILNTSFNLHGYPIVWDSEEAVDIFQKTSMRYLILNELLITKLSAVANHGFSH